MTSIIRIVLMNADGIDRSEAGRAAHGWARSVDATYLGTLDGSDAPRLGQRCKECGRCIVEVGRA